MSHLWGHIKLIIKTDNEPALRKLASVSLGRIRCQIGQEDSTVEKISSEQSAEYESASNGGTECGIRNVRGLFRNSMVSKGRHGPRSDRAGTSRRKARGGGG